MKLVYLSPVPWDSFAQRPHHFVEWFHACTGAEVLWLDPYPTRFPTIADVRLLGKKRDHISKACPPWLKRLRPASLPIEPLPGSGWLNQHFWRSTVQQVQQFCRTGHCALVMGKPSLLGLQLLAQARFRVSIYDAMDDFPAFFSGLSRLAARRRELAVATRVQQVLASSSALAQRWTPLCQDVRLVHNGIDPLSLPKDLRSPRTGERRVLGYVGTMGRWFDWDLVIDLANAMPMDEVRLIGPVFTPAGKALPSNVRMFPPLDHGQAMQAMLDFDVGLIPFKINRLSDSVDPIKFYEYRALSLPVISTAFGEMKLRGSEPGTFSVRPGDPLAKTVAQALALLPQDQEREIFINRNSWQVRFDAIKELVQVPPA